jgi:cytochrome c oxidase subunit 1/cytochrome c oxidase subunit I+III
MNLVSTAGAFLMAAASLLLVWNLVASLLGGARAGDNPWKAWTLEWATTSPPPPENFQRLPPIRSRRPLWDEANPGRPDPMVGTKWQAETFTPEKNKTAVVAFIISETAFFAVLILAYLFYNAGPPAGLGAQDLNLAKTGLFSLCLFASSFTLWRSEVSLDGGRERAMRVWLAATILLGGVFLVGQGLEYGTLFKNGASVNMNLFATTFFTLTGFHGLHVCVGLIALLIVLGLTLPAGCKRRPSPALKAVALYWHFVDGVWLVVFSTIYLLPHLR